MSSYGQAEIADLLALLISSELARPQGCNRHPDPLVSGVNVITSYFPLCVPTLADRFLPNDTNSRGLVFGNQPTRDHR